MTSWRSFWHFLEGNNLGILIDTVAILSGQRIVVSILGGEGIVPGLLLLNISYIVIICVMFNSAPLGGFTIVYWGLYPGFDKWHFSDYSLDSNHLVHEISLKSSGSDKVGAKVAFKIHMIDLDFFGEFQVLLVLSHLLLILQLTTISFLEWFDPSIDFTFKELNSLKRVLDYKLSEFGIEFP